MAIPTAEYAEPHYILFLHQDYIQVGKRLLLLNLVQDFRNLS